MAARGNGRSRHCHPHGRLQLFPPVKGTKLTTIFAIVALAIGVAVAAGPIFTPRCSPVSGESVVTASLDLLTPGTARFFCYRDRAGHEVRFVLARANDGIVRSVFDACRQCYRFHKGYTVADGFLICRLCGNRYRLDQMQTGMASCQPVQLENSQHGNTVEVRVAALEKGQQLF
jgi:uncharacterized membrane protein